MGMAPSADLYWGFDLGDMTDKDWNSLKPSWMGGGEDESEEQDWEEVYAERAVGWTEAPFPEHLAPDRSAIRRQYRDFVKAEAEIKKVEDVFHATPEYQAWSASREKLREIIDGCPVKLDTYGYMDDPGHFVYVIASHQRIDDYGSIELNPLVVDPAWKNQLLNFMKLMELTIPDGQAPAWRLNCSYS